MFISLVAQGNVREKNVDCYVQAQGKSVKTQWGKSAPYFELDTSGIESSGQVIYEGFVNYINALSSCITDQIPEVLRQAENLPSEAEDAQRNAQAEIEKLDFMKKPQAVLAIAYNIKQLSKVPAFIKNGVQGFKEELQDIQDTFQTV